MIKHKIKILVELDFKNLVKSCVPIGVIEDVLSELGLTIVPKEYDTLHDQQQAFEREQKENPVDCETCEGNGIGGPLDYLMERLTDITCWVCQGETQLCAYCSGTSKTCECGS